MKTKLLLTPGPLTTSSSVKEAMLTDKGTRDSEYQEIVGILRDKLLSLADADKQQYTCVLLQGSGTYGVESVLTSTIEKTDKVLILANGAYGERMRDICEKAEVPYEFHGFTMTEALSIETIEPLIKQKEITHVAYIHCETTVGVLNDIKQIQQCIKKYHKISIVDAMSSFASLPFSITALDIDFLIASSNKCLHGVPGIAIIFAKKDLLNTCKGICKSLSLDLYEQNLYMEMQNNAFRFTSPTHVILGLDKAVNELVAIGGITMRHKRYLRIQKAFHDCMKACGFQTLLTETIQCPVITTYLIPEHFNFQDFYDYMKRNDILLYSGKLPNVDAFRIGNIGEITDTDIQKFCDLVIKYQEEHHAN